METKEKKVKTKRKGTKALHVALAKEVAQDLKDGGQKTRRELMENAGYSKASADSNQRKVYTSEGFRRELAKQGFTEELKAKVFQEAAQANIVTIFKGQATETDVADHKIRMQAISLAGDFTGDKKTVHEVKSINVNLKDADIAQFLGLLGI